MWKVFRFTVPQILIRSGNKCRIPFGDGNKNAFFQRFRSVTGILHLFPVRMGMKNSVEEGNNVLNP